MPYCPLSTLMSVAVNTAPSVTLIAAAYPAPAWHFSTVTRPPAALSAG
jgi:hypothetical protein